jgi:hypothetical protein
MGGEVRGPDFSCDVLKIKRADITMQKTEPYSDASAREDVQDSRFKFHEAERLESQIFSDLDSSRSYMLGYKEMKKRRSLHSICNYFRRLCGFHGV